MNAHTTTNNDHSDSSNKTTTDAQSQLCPRVCRDIKQFQVKQCSRVWIVFDSVSGSVRCASWIHVKSSGLHAQQGEHCESAFVNGTGKCKDKKGCSKN